MKKQSNLKKASIRCILEVVDLVAILLKHG